MTVAKKPKKPAPPSISREDFIRKYEEWEAQGFPTPLHDRLDAIANKVAFLGLSVPSDTITDEAQMGFSAFLFEIAEEIRAVAVDIAQKKPNAMEA
jgi:hypothetical protein